MCTAAAGVKFVQNALNLILMDDAQVRARERPSVQVIIQIQEVIGGSAPDLVSFSSVRGKDMGF